MIEPEYAVKFFIKIASQQQAVTHKAQLLQREYSIYGASPGSIWTIARVRQAWPAKQGRQLWQIPQSISGRNMNTMTYMVREYMRCVL